MIECRGRNGWFKLHEASTVVYSDGTALASLSDGWPYQSAGADHLC